MDALPGSTVVLTENPGETIYNVTLLTTLSGSIPVDVDLDFAGGTIQLSGGQTITADVEIHLVFGVDGNGFFLDVNNAHPELAVRNIRTIGEVRGYGRVGFLEVGVSDLALAVDPSVAFTVDLTEPAGPADHKIRLADLLAAPSGMVALNLTGNPAVDDVVLTGTFSVGAVLPGMEAPFEIGDAKVDLKWADVTSISSFSVSATPGFPGGQAVLDFLSVNAQALLDRLYQLRDSMAIFDAYVPFLQDGLDQVIGLAETVEAKLLAPLSNVGTHTVAFTTIQGFVGQTAREMKADPAGMGLNYDSASKQLTYRPTLHLDFTGTEVFDFGLNAVSGGATVDVRGTLDLDLTLGVDLGQILAGGNSLDYVFIRNATLAGAIDLSSSDLTASCTLGPVQISMTGGEVAGNVNISVVLTDPGTTVSPQSAGRIDLRELVDGLTGDPASLIGTSDISGAVTMHGLTVSIAGFVMLSGDFVVGQSTFDRVTVTNGAVSEQLTRVPVLTFAADSGAVFVGTNGGTPSEIGFSTTINNLAVAILEDPAGGRTWQTVKGDLASAGLTGIPGLTATAANLAVDVNATASDGTYVDFALVDADGNGADGSLTVMAGDAALALDYRASILKTSGELSLDLFGHVIGTAAFEITQTTTDVVTGNTGIPGSGAVGPDTNVPGTLKNASLLTATLRELNLFAGLGASLNMGDPADVSDDVIVTAGAIGFCLLGGALEFAVVRPAGLSADDETSYTGLEVNLSAAQLVGVEAVDLRVSGTFVLNVATADDGSAASERIDWAGATTTPAGLLPALSATKEQQLSVNGSGSLDLANGRIVAVVSDLTLDMATMDVVTGNATLGTLADAETFSLAVAGASLFVGAGGALTAARDGIVTTGAVGFHVTDASFTLASIKSGSNSYTGLSAAVTDAGFLGTEGLNLWATGMVRLNQTTRADAERIDWAIATQGSNDPQDLLANLDVGRAVQLQVAGSAAVDAYGFLVAVADDFTMSVATADVATGNAAMGTLADASVISITLGGLDAFAGMGTSLNGTHDAIVTEGALGFEVTGGSVSLAIVKPVAAGADDQTSYIGVEGGLSSAELVGFAGLSLQASGFVLINRATDAAGQDAAERVNWATATDAGGFLPDFTSALTDSVELAIEGEASLDILGFVVGTAGFAFTTRQVEVDVDADGILGLRYGRRVAGDIIVGQRQRLRRFQSRWV